jgi:hypothetical protein
MGGKVRKRERQKDEKRERGGGGGGREKEKGGGRLRRKRKGPFLEVLCLGSAKDLGQHMPEDMANKIRKND